jgi:hypothetical protein
MKVFILCFVLAMGFNLTVSPGPYPYPYPYPAADTGTAGADAYAYAAPGKDIDLVKMKKEEEERKKKIKKSGQTFTNEDLKRMKESKDKANITEVEPAAGTVENTAGDAANPDQGTKDKETGGDDSLKTESYWRGLKSDLEGKIMEAEKVIKQNEERLLQLNNQLNSPDILLSDQLRVEEGIRQAQDTVTNYKDGLETLKKDLEELLEKARKAGVPPGWLRD